MNRRERRALERAGKLPKREPVYTLKASDIAKTALQGAAKEAMDREINRQLLVKDKEFTMDMDSMVLSTLHEEYGWGPKRCKEFYIKMFQHHLEMREYYEMDELYPERHRLKEHGIDVEAWFNELFDDHGNFKNPSEVTL